MIENKTHNIDYSSRAFEAMKADALKRLIGNNVSPGHFH